VPPGSRPAGVAPDVSFLDHDRAVAYTLPGWHSRIVLTAGLLDLLAPVEVAAVLEHERAHLRFRHDLLTLPFQAWARALGRIPGVRAAHRSVAELAEVLADDQAADRVDRRVLAGALAKVALSGAPVAIGADGTRSSAGAVDRRTTADDGIDPAGAAARVRRLLDPHPMPRWATALVLLAAALLLAVPTTLLLLGWR
jgi:Zn-dependent protease with chaperone function